ncbi:MAG: MotA/TolQ/ExbB proton channel family protein [Chitinivibrionales bacterium]
MIQTIATFFNSGGRFMWVILIVMALSTAIVIERMIFYFIVCRVNAVRLVSDLAKALTAGGTDAALKVLHKGGSPLKVLLRVAIDRFGAQMSVGDVEEGIQEAAITQMPRMTARLNYLSLFSNIATLLGLLGTISGLQASFSSLAAVEASKKATMLAAGIAEAMNCTAFGLIVAVPCMVMYTVLYNKQQQLTKALDESVVRIVNFMKKSKA